MKNLFKVENVYLKEDEGNVKAYLWVSVAGVVLIKGVKVIEGDNGLFVSLPQRQVHNEETGEVEYKNICHILNGYKAEFQTAILRVYKAYKHKVDNSK